jgi:hypothetical protein
MSRLTDPSLHEEAAPVARWRRRLPVAFRILLKFGIAPMLIGSLLGPAAAGAAATLGAVLAALRGLGVAASQGTLMAVIVARSNRRVARGGAHRFRSRRIVVQVVDDAPHGGGQLTNRSAAHPVGRGRHFYRPRCRRRRSCIHSRRNRLGASRLVSRRS